MKDWKRLGAAGDKLRARWVHASGWEVRHCGHPTANWPYCAVDPEHPGRVTADASGRGFRTLEQAFAAVDGVLAGRLAVYDDGPTKHGHRQVIADPCDLPRWLERQIGAQP